MLERERWEHVAPEVPEEFHTRFEQTLGELDRRKAGKVRGIGFRVMVAAAAVCVLASGTVLAAEWFGWNPTILEKYQPSEEQQESLPEEGIIQDVSQTVTHDGVDVTLTQVLHDDYNLYMLCEVQLPDGVQATEDLGFANGMDVLIDGKPAGDICEGSSGGSGGVIIPENAESSDTLTYEISYLFGSPVDWNGRTITLTFDALRDYQGIKAPAADDGTLIAEGPWSFEYTIDGSSDMVRTYEINQTYDFGGYDILINRIEISPLSYKIYADYESAMRVEEDARNTFTYEGDDPGLDIGARLSVRKIVYDDRTQLDYEAEDYFTGGGIYGPDEERSEYQVIENFTRIIDVDHIESIYLMQGDVEIPLQQS